MREAPAFSASMFIVAVVFGGFVFATLITTQSTQNAQQGSECGTIESVDPTGPYIDVDLIVEKDCKRNLRLVVEYDYQGEYRIKTYLFPLTDSSTLTLSVDRPPVDCYQVLLRETNDDVVDLYDSC